MSLPCRICCPAKINLYLEVGEKRPDGFHDVRTVMQSVDLYDEILIKERSKGITLECDHATLPLNSSNLCWRAAELFRRKTGSKRGAHIRIKKMIPVAAGLGGGSSDAAGVLVLLARVWGFDFSNEGLRDLAAELGSDVPFFIEGGTTLCTGRGEEVHPIDNASSYPYVLITPPIEVSTSAAYGSLSKSEGPSREKEESLIHALSSPDPQRVASNLYNRLEESNQSYLSVVKDIKLSLMKRGTLGACMSGSGPSVFGITKSLSEARRIIREFGKEVGEGFSLHSGITNVRYSLK